MSDLDMYSHEEGDRPVERSPRGRYIRFDIRLGTGAYKTVYKAYDTDQGIDVAWNAIDIGVLPSSEKTRIIQEVQLLQKLEHKNIINFYGSWFSKEKNQVVFITEIMTSGNLKSYIKRVQFVKWKIIKRWCIQILEGLHYLHSQHPPVIHRDLKCDNIFINGNTGDLRIGDLGLSTQLAVHKRSRAQSVLGTPEFMAPELYDESYDEKVDIYAFGMCVLEMVTKEVPYSECINPAQIYKKVTAGIRPRGLQRIISQAARDFIELCLSRGNGEVDVSAEYLLNHPFLKAHEDDGEMVRVLADDELERELPPPAEMNTKAFAEELNMESGSKGKDQTVMSDRRKNNLSLSLEPEELSTGSGANSRATSRNSSGVMQRNEIPAEEKSAGKHRMLLPTKASSDFDRSAARPNAALPPLAPAATVAAEPVVDEPLSDKKDVDHNVEKFLSTMPGSESKIRNDRIAVMGGRGHRIEIDEAQVFSDDDVDAKKSSPDVTESDDSTHAAAHPRLGSISTSAAPEVSVERPRATTIDTPRVSRPPSAARKRGKRYEIKASKDPENDHSILLNLRIAIAGKSKEIKFPFNLFTDSSHEVACELAADVGILEPDLEDIADSISFLVTEGKINNLVDFDQDIWDEAPEPHSFSNKPLPHVSKMSFGALPAHHAMDELPTRDRSPTSTTPGDIREPLQLSATPSQRASQPIAQPGSSSSISSGSFVHEGSGGIRAEAARLMTDGALGGSGKALTGERSRSPSRVGMVHASSENSLYSSDEYAMPEMRERGVSMGSSADPNYVRNVRHYDDRLKVARSTYDEEAMLSRQEEHQRDLRNVERIRQTVQQYSEMKTAEKNPTRSAASRPGVTKQHTEDYMADSETSGDEGSVVTRSRTQSPRPQHSSRDPDQVGYARTASGSSVGDGSASYRFDPSSSRGVDGGIVAPGSYVPSTFVPAAVSGDTVSRRS